MKSITLQGKVTLILNLEFLFFKGDSIEFEMERILICGIFLAPVIERKDKICSNLKYEENKT